MHKRKKVQGKISSVHLGCCNLDLTLLIVQHISGKRVDVGQIMQACIILHNMIIEDQRQPGAMSFDLNSTPGLSYALPPAVRIGNNMCLFSIEYYETK